MILLIGMIMMMMIMRISAHRPCNIGSHLWIGCHCPGDNDGYFNDDDGYFNDDDDDGFNDSDDDQTHPASTPCECEARFLFWRIEISH